MEAPQENTERDKTHDPDERVALPLMGSTEGICRPW